MDEDLKLYIPLGVKPEAELFTGFGKKQLFQALIGSLFLGVWPPWSGYSPPM